MVGEKYKIRKIEISHKDLIYVLDTGGRVSVINKELGEEVIFVLNYQCRGTFNFHILDLPIRE
jgi:hypothetical protein